MKIKQILPFLLFLVSAMALHGEAYPPEGWTQDLLGAIAESEETGKNLLLNYTGSDWCIWCKKLRAEVFDTQEFKDYARENLILVFLDFPNGITQSQEIQKQNQVMAALFGVQGFPTLLLLDSDLVPLLQAGYQEGGSGPFIQNLENNRFELTSQQKSEIQAQVKDVIRNNIGSW